MAQKKRFVAPRLYEEAPLATLTQVLQSPGGDFLADAGIGDA